MTTLLQPAEIEAILRLCAALVCAGVIGLERDRRNMPTGFRTLGLVGLGSCAAVLSTQSLSADSFSRVAQGVVTGIGFLGAGVIVKGRHLRDIKGLTTAAAIWLAAAVGILCGSGQIILAATASALAVAVLLADALTGDSQDADVETPSPQASADAKPAAKPAAPEPPP